MSKTDIAIIGGGASGLMAAVAAKNEDTNVTVFERTKRVGKKILATGNGRCNMTNTGAGLKNYHGKDPSFVNGAIKRFWVNETLELFSELGILWKEEERGKVYPYSDTASAVLDVLRRRVERTGTEVRCDLDVRSIEKKNGKFIVRTYSGTEDKFDKVIIAAGGKAAPDLGSNGSGYELLKSFGHKITALRPSLVQIKTDTDIVKKLKGIKIDANVTIGRNSSRGELLFTDYGLSGPPIFELTSRLDGDKTIEIDMMPDHTSDDVLNIIYERMAYLYDVPLEEFFTGMLNKRVGQALLKSVGVAPLSRESSSLTEAEAKKIVSAIKGWRFNITGTMSWNNAQVTKGGAETAGFDSATMESKLIKGLYACGEVLDIDGDCGGYNLQWAWSSGYIAGKNAAMS